jgi:hypothetical protein
VYRRVLSEKGIAGVVANADGGTRIVEMNIRHPHPQWEIVRQSLCNFVR